MKQQIWNYVWLGLGLIAALTFFMPGISYAGVAEENSGCLSLESWEEEYTDTDTGRGTLAVRCETFKGFHGTIELRIQGLIGGREFTASLTEEGGYRINLTLPVESYVVRELKAVSDRWNYACQAEQTELDIVTGATSLLKVRVTANGILTLPDEEAEVKHSPEISGSERSHKTQETEEELVTEAVKRKTKGRQIPPFLIAGVFGLVACLAGVYYVVKKNRTGG